MIGKKFGKIINLDFVFKIRTIESLLAEIRDKIINLDQEKVCIVFEISFT